MYILPGTPRPKLKSGRDYREGRGPTNSLGGPRALSKAALLTRCSLRRNPREVRRSDGATLSVYEAGYRFSDLVLSDRVDSYFDEINFSSRMSNIDQ